MSKYRRGCLPHRLPSTAPAAYTAACREPGACHGLHSFWDMKAGFSPTAPPPVCSFASEAEAACVLTRPKSRHFHYTVGSKEHVVRLYVAVDQPFLMSVNHRFTALKRLIQDGVELSLFIAFEPLSQRSAVDILDEDPGDAFIFTYVEGCRNVGVLVQIDPCIGFPQKAMQYLIICFLFPGGTSPRA